MRELAEQFELLKEIHYGFQNDNPDFKELPKIIGKIYLVVLSGAEEKYKYSWEISHFCRLEDEMEPHTPGKKITETQEQAERLLSTYIKRFKNAVDWKVNKSF